MQARVTDVGQLPMLMTAKDIQALGFSRPTAYQLLNREDFPVIRIGKKVFIKKDAFLSWLDKQKTSEGGDNFGLNE